MEKAERAKNFLKRAFEVHGKKYNYDDVVYVNNTTKVKIKCPIHGFFEQMPGNHAKGCGCKKCGNQVKNKKNKFDKEKFIKLSKEKHGDRYDYSLVEYVNCYTKVDIICKTHGVFKQVPHSHYSAGSGCIKCAEKVNGYNLRKGLQEFVEAANLVHGNKYEYSEYFGSHKQVKIKCPTHGFFYQTPSNHLAGKNCMKCSIESRAALIRLSNEQFIERANIIHDFKYDYSCSEYKNGKDQITIICPIHGQFQQMAINHLCGKGCRKCSSSQGEREVRKILKTRKIPFKEQYSFSECKNKYELPFDFYLPKHNACIEYDGIQHYQPVAFFGGEEKYRYVKNNDNIKNAYCRDNNIKLLRIRYDEDIELVLTEFLSAPKLTD